MAQEIMFNTRPERMAEARRNPDVATMRISSFMINNGSRQPGTLNAPAKAEEAAALTKDAKAQDGDDKMGTKVEAGAELAGLGEAPKT